MNSKFSACHRNVAQLVEPHFDGVFLNIFCNHLPIQARSKITLWRLQRFSEIGHRGHWQVAYKPSFMCHLSVSPEPELEKLCNFPKVIQLHLLRTLYTALALWTLLVYFLFGHALVSIDWESWDWPNGMYNEHRMALSYTSVQGVLPEEVWTCHLRFFSWLLNHMIYFKLRKKNTTVTSWFFTQNDNFARTYLQLPLRNGVPAMFIS